MSNECEAEVDDSSSELHAAHCLVQAAHLVAELLAVVVDQRVGHRLQVAGDDLVELVQREADAVVGQAILREVVGANPLAAVAGADEASCVRRPAWRLPSAS